MTPLPPGAGGAPRGALMLVLGAGVMGAAGVALAAIAAHHTQSPALATAAQMLMVHAAAVLAVAGFSRVADRGQLWRSAGLLMLAAVTLFSGDVTLHTLTGNHVFPYAAPMGGSLTIASWLVVAATAGWSLLKGEAVGR